jgi:hypothetical protein
VFKLEFGPKAFIVVSDPTVVRHLLKVRCGDLGASLGRPCRPEQGCLGGCQSRGRHAISGISLSCAFRSASARPPPPVPTSPDFLSRPLQENHTNYDKGVLAEILEPIMGKGLIPADLETWKVRRRAIVPGEAPPPCAGLRLHVPRRGGARMHGHLAPALQERVPRASPSACFSRMFSSA